MTPAKKQAPVTDDSPASGSSSEAKAPDEAPTETTVTRDDKKGITKVSGPGWPQQPGVPPQ